MSYYLSSVYALMLRILFIKKLVGLGVGFDEKPEEFGG